VCVFALDIPRHYQNDNGEGRQMLNAEVTDATRAAKAVVYDPAKFARFQGG